MTKEKEKEVFVNKGNMKNTRVYIMATQKNLSTLP